MARIRLLRVAIKCLGIAVFAHSAVAQSLQWESVGRRDDYEISWAKNMLEPTSHGVMTMMRLKYDKPDQAPNNARFDNQRIGVQLQCETGEYMLLGMSYNMGNREVYDESAGTAFKPYAGTFIEKFAVKACASYTKALPAAKD